MMSLLNWRLPAAFALLVLAGLVLQSCATMTKQQCLTADWNLIGQRDGVTGRPLSRFEKHVDACKKTSAIPDKTAWREGHRIGARLYCQPANAFDVGRRGLDYHYICEPDQHTVFVRVFRLGRKEYNLKYRRDKLERDIRSYRLEIEQLEEKRKKGEIDKHSAQIATDSLNRQIWSAESALETAEEDLASFKARLLRDGYLKMAMR